MHPIPKNKCFSSIEARCWVENEDVDGAVPKDDAPTTSEWSTILFPSKVPLILDIWWYIKHNYLQYATGRFILVISSFVSVT